MDVTRYASVAEFFHEVVSEAMQRQHVSTLDAAEFYLVTLLGDFTRGRISDEPLALRLAGAHPDSAGERVKTLKEVGDTTLYVAGFFAESLESKLVGTDYYIGVGKAAYSELASRMTGSALCELYEELAANFPRFVDVLNEVRSQVNFAGSDVVKLYEEWLRTRSEWVERRLRALGVRVIDPTPDGKKTLQ